MGSVLPYETAAGKRYRVLYRKPDHGQGQKRGFATKREAERFLHAVEHSKNRGEFIDNADAAVTVGELGALWLADQTHLKPSALRPVQVAWRVYVEPQWGKSQVGKIKHSQVQSWVSAITTGTAKTTLENPGPRSPTVVLRAYGILAAILDNAVKDRRLLVNPARGVNLPRKTRKAHSYLTHEQVEMLAQVAGIHGTMVRFLAYTGLRWGEAVGLRVRDVDALKRRMTVRENAVTVGGKIEVGTPKSHASRTVPYPRFLEFEIAEQCSGKSPSSLVFGDGDRHVAVPSSRDGWYQAAIKRAQLLDPTFPTLTIHDLRHTAASLAIATGANVKAVQRMLGHASAAMTLDVYSDLFDTDLDAVSEALDQARSNSNVAKSFAKPSFGEGKIASLPRK